MSKSSRRETKQGSGCDSARSIDNGEIIDKPKDFEPDVIKACMQGKLTSLKYLYQEGEEFDSKDADISFVFL